MIFSLIKYNNNLKILFAGIFCIGILLVPCYFTQALTVSPARVELGGNPGQTLTGEYILINEQNVTKTFYSSFENFEAQGETGTPNFVGGQEGLATWINSPSKIVLGPHETKKLQYSITIPTNSDPGGHFAAIFWGTSDPEANAGEGEVFVGAKLGIVILLRVSGDIKVGGGVLDFKTLNKQRSEEEGIDEQKLFIILPVDFNYRFQNSGDDRIKPKGTVTIKNMFGMTSSILNANAHEGNVLPSSIRKFKLFWNGADGKKVEQQEKPDSFVETVKYQISHFALGYYTAHLELTYGAGNELESNAKTTFFVFPWQLLIVVLLSLFVIILLLRSYNKMIIKRAQRINNISSDSNDISSGDAKVRSETQQSKTE